MNPWAELVALAERERDLVRAERWDELPALSAQRLRACEALGAPPRHYLERLIELQDEIVAGLSAGRAFTLQKLAEMNRGATAIRGYAGGPRPSGSTIDGRA